MKLSKRQKVFVVLLGLALGGLAVDRVFLGSGASGPSQAAAVSPRETAKRSTPTYRVVATATSAEPRSLAERLAALSQTHDADLANIHDALSLPSAWKAQSSEQEKTNPKLTAVEVFTQAHELTAVVISGQAAVAVVDDHCVSVGQFVDNFKLVSVGQNSATFESQGRRAVLKLKGGK